MDDDNEFPLPDGLTVDDLIRVCDEASSHKQQCTLPNNESTTKVEKDVSINIVSPMKKKKRIRPHLIKEIYSRPSSLGSKGCKHCYCDPCQDDVFGEFCVMSVYHFCLTFGSNPDLDWTDCKCAFEDSYKQIMRVSIFLQTNVYESNSDYLSVPECMVTNSLKEARRVFENKNNDLTQYEKKYRSGAVFSMENNYH